MSIPGAILLCLVIGILVGSAASLLFQWRGSRFLASTAVAAIGSLFAGFVLPQLGLPVSSTMVAGLVTCAIGAALPVALIRFVQR